MNDLDIAGLEQPIAIHVALDKTRSPSIDLSDSAKVATYAEIVMVGIKIRNSGTIPKIVDPKAMSAAA